MTSNNILIGTGLIGVGALLRDGHCGDSLWCRIYCHLAERLML